MGRSIERRCATCCGCYDFGPRFAAESQRHDVQFRMVARKVVLSGKVVTFTCFLSYGCVCARLKPKLFDNHVWLCRWLCAWDGGDSLDGVPRRAERDCLLLEPRNERGVRPCSLFARRSHSPHSVLAGLFALSVLEWQWIQPSCLLCVALHVGAVEGTRRFGGGRLFA